MRRSSLAIGSLVIRYRRGDDTERRQLLWLVLACLVVFGYAGLWWGLTGTGPVLALLVIPLIPAAVTVAILKYQLLDIRLVFSPDPGVGDRDRPAGRRLRRARPADYPGVPVP
ncbi:MAG: hypothetical protein ACRDOK_00135 [Streptosporangiaceae bacterium]